jgi:hypothetical protein
MWWHVVPDESSWQRMVSDGAVAWVTIQRFGKVCRIVTPRALSGGSVNDGRGGEDFMIVRPN